MTVAVLLRFIFNIVLCKSILNNTDMDYIQGKDNNKMEIMFIKKEDKEIQENEGKIKKENKQNVVLR